MTAKWTFDDVGFAADVEAILAEQRAKRMQHRQAWDRAAALQSLEDYDDAEGDRLARNSNQAATRRRECAHEACLLGNVPSLRHRNAGKRSIAVAVLKGITMPKVLDPYVLPGCMVGPSEPCDAFTILQDKLTKAEQQMTWRPIETAPRDGTRILVFRPGEHDFEKIGIDFWKSHVWWHSQRDGQPTFWMPLPLPPPETRRLMR
jgi:hypothetical protein